MSDKPLLHQHLIIRAEVNDPIMEPETLKSWLKQFVKFIGMRVFVGPITGYLNEAGNRGISGVVIIKTSHLSIHIWDEIHPALIQMDIYSCSAIDPVKCCKKIAQDMKAIKLEYKFIDRENHLITLVDDETYL